MDLAMQRILLQEIGQLLADNIVHGSTGLAVAQFLFGLSLKLGILHFDTDDGCQPLTYILAGQVILICPLTAFLPGIVVEGLGQGRS